MQGNNIGIQPLDLNLPTSRNVFVLGDVFLQSFYTIFDQQHNRVGIANAYNVTHNAATYAIKNYYNTIQNNNHVPINNPTVFYNPPDVNTYLDDLKAMNYNQQAYTNSQPGLSSSSSSGHIGSFIDNIVESISTSSHTSLWKQHSNNNKHITTKQHTKKSLVDYTRNNQLQHDLYAARFGNHYTKQI